jgi:HKD family nuclease
MPARIHHFIPEEETFEYRLRHRLDNCQRAILATAFLTWSGFHALKDSIKAALEAGAKITFLIGRFDYVTEPRAVDALLRLRLKHKDKLTVRFDSDYRFHYKLATFKTGGANVVVIGSSNLTGKGLSSVGEANLEIVGHEAVYKDAVNLLDQRIKSAPEADEEIDEYRKAYNRAKKYRKLRQSLMKSGSVRWRKQRKRAPKTDKLTASTYPFCWTNELEDDETLTDNANREYERQTKSGNYFPQFWFRNNSVAPLIKENTEFLMLDEAITKPRLGIAICTRKIRVLNEHNRRSTVVFFKYRRGLSAGFKDKQESRKLRQKLGIRDVTSTSPTVTQRVKRYLLKSQARKR